MRNVIPRGGARFVQGSQVATTTAAAVVGTEVDIDIPTGCVAIVSVTGFLVPSANTIAGYVLVDGAAGSVQMSTAVNATLAANAEVYSGKHRIAVGFNGSSAAGTIQTSTISWIIVARDGKR